MRLWVTLLLVGCGSGDPYAEVCGQPPSTPSGDLVGTGALQFAGRAPRNLLFLSIDTLRKDHVGLYSSTASTPAIDCLGERGVVLEDMQQCSNWTYASTTCTLAGRTNIERGHLPRLRGSDDQRTKVPNGEPLLAGILGDAGFYSIIVSTNEWLSEKWGNTQGYDEEYDPFGGGGRVISKGISALQSAIRRGDADRWFLHLHVKEPHAPYNPPSRHLEALDELEEWPENLANRETHYATRNDWGNLTKGEQSLLEQHLRVRYRGEVSLLDELVAEGIADLQRAGLLDDTLVVVWSDHGEAFWEHGFQTHAFFLFGEENDAIGVFWAKNIVPTRVAGPTHAIDLVPTVLEALEVDVPNHVTGIAVGLAPDDRFRFSSALARKSGVQTVERNGLRMQYRWFDGRVDVFDKTVDPGETTNVFNPRLPEQLALWDALRPQIEAMDDLVVGDPTPVWPASLPRP